MRPRTTSRRNPRLPRRPRTTAPTRRRGAAALEFALVLPVLLTLLLGITDFGRFSHSRIAVNNAARCGAGYASMNPYSSSGAEAWKAGVKETVTNELSGFAAFDPEKLTVTSTNVVESGGLRRVSVQVVYPFETLVNWPLLPSSVNLQHSVVMRGIR